MRLHCYNCDKSVDVEFTSVDSQTVCPDCGEGIDVFENEEPSGTLDFDLSPRVVDKPTPIDGRIGRYHLKQLLCTGSMGQVWRAWDDCFQRDVAVKSAVTAADSELARDRYLRKVRVMSRLEHSNIVRVYDAVIDERVVHIVREYVEGRNLREWTLKQDTEREVAEICVPIADALHHAHTRGIVHRDVKPHHVIVDAHDRLRILAFGLAEGEEGLSTPTSLWPHVRGTFGI